MHVRIVKIVLIVSIIGAALLSASSVYLVVVDHAPLWRLLWALFWLWLGIRVAWQFRIGLPPPRCPHCNEPMVLSYRPGPRSFARRLSIAFTCPNCGPETAKVSDEALARTNGAAGKD